MIERPLLYIYEKIQLLSIQRYTCWHRLPALPRQGITSPLTAHQPPPASCNRIPPVRGSAVGQNHRQEPDLPNLMAKPVVFHSRFLHIRQRLIVNTFMHGDDCGNAKGAEQSTFVG